MSDSKATEQQTHDERERDEVLRIMVKTPPKPHKPLGKERKAGQGGGTKAD